MDTPYTPTPVVDRSDAYTPDAMPREPAPLTNAEIAEIAETHARADAAFMREEGLTLDGDVNLDAFEATLRDAYANALTGIGRPGADKTMAAGFLLQLMTSWEAMNRWRGSDLGARIIETIPNEMTRKGWKIEVQPEQGEFDHDTDPVNLNLDAVKRFARRALARLGVRRDEWPDATQQNAAPTHTPGDLPHLSEDGSSIVQALVNQQRRLGFADAIRQALCYVRAYGGAGILLGVDDGNQPLTTPLDPTKLQTINHLTVCRGGWDGELVGWRYYSDPRHPKWGQPEIYMLRNLGVPIAGAPAPGEDPRIAYNEIPQGAAAATIFFVHESRLLVFDGHPVSRWAQVQMRGWSDTIFTRIDRVLSQYDQTWSAIAILMQETNLPVISIEGFTKLLASKTKDGMATIIAMARAQQLAMSVAQARMIDTTGKIERLKLDLSGVPEVLEQMNLRLAAAAGMPVSMLMGQVQGGLGDASKGDIVFFYDQIAGKQDDEVLPHVERLTKLQFYCKKTSPTNGKVPQRWSVTMNPLLQMSDAETAKYELEIAKKDQIYIETGVATPEEVAGTRFGTSQFNPGPIVLDLEARAAMVEAKTQDPQLPRPAVAGPTTTPTDPAAPPPAPAPTPVHDAADFVTRNGRTKVRTAVSIVAAFNTDGLVLLGKRADSGKYSFPGGHAEPGEDPMATAVRELWEETGLHARRMTLAGTKTVGGALAHVQISVFRALVDGQPTAANDPDKEFASFEWVDMTSGHLPEEVKALLHHERDVVGPILRRR